MTLFRAFVDAPLDTLDLSCLDEVLPLQFDGYPGYVEYFFGTDDAWGDAAP